MNFLDFLKKFKLSRDDEEGFPPLPDGQQDPAVIREQFESIRASILPVIDAVPSAQEDVVQETLVGVLSLRYVVDQGGMTQPLLSEQLPPEVDSSALRAIAVENLMREQRFAVRTTKVGAYGLQGDAEHTASFLLNDEVWHRLAEKLGEDLVLAAPSREILLFAPISQMDAIARMGQAARSLYSRAAAPLTLKLLCYRREARTLELWDL